MSLIPRRFTVGRLLFYATATFLAFLFFRAGLQPLPQPQQPTSNSNERLVEPETPLLANHPVLTPEARSLRRRIDEKYCGTSPCRFLLPVAITEQGICWTLESKAQLHFRHLAFVSGTLHRTVVLPNVFGSHLGVCRHHPFTYYYSLSWLDANSHRFSYITLDRFRDWLNERNVTGARPTHREHYIQANNAWTFLSKEKNCFKDLLNNAGLVEPKRSELADPLPSKRRLNMTQALVNMLSDGKMDEVDEKPWEVVSLYYDRRFGFIEDPAADVPLTYATHWTTTAAKLASQLTPFVAIHWRMERVEEQQNLLPCAETLVRYLRAHILSPESTAVQSPNIFLLTDYPHLLNASTGTESMSFKGAELTLNHHAAINYLHANLNLTLTVLANPKKPIPYDKLPAKNWNLVPVSPNVRPVDPSVLGIVDKLIAMKAQWFLAGRPVECAKESSFTLRIIKERTARWKKVGVAEDERGDMKNAWELFGVADVDHDGGKEYVI
ncbi:hypothetical protein BC936DRAFT_142385 [Jimgerdemannia flammicorona]|uniref:Uncharacterized protein n=2 Tax=Jimgerdemannia flammicorona TaxID=994334 RepID=A0A433PNL1_9FUNG|nr:hypothetical protein BC936DRAFT_142385 [Jimgerdemannia flammicorona]RUS19055.1 hypothetical protein BC938DRAFT_475824 [Jimgerdemannia flammicorona]